MGTNSQYQNLIEKLDQFIRKYYTNQLIRGGIFAVIYVLAFFLSINFLEYYLYLSPFLRKVLFFGFIASSLAFIVKFFALPLFHYYRLGDIISHEKAAEIIGNHFKEVKDKLLNILQLKKLETLNDYSLVNASINQKITELKPVSFSNAIDLNKNKKYLKFLLPPVLLLLFIIIAAPNIIKEGSKRLYHNDTAFEKEAPFHFVIKNKSLRAMQFENYELQVTTDGEAVPNEISLETDKNIFKLKKQKKNLFTYEFNNLQKSLSFKLSANGFYSKEYILAVVAKPVVAGFEITASYPAYTGKQNEVIKNAGDLVVPAGTKLSWNLDAKNTDAIQFVLGDSVYNMTRSGDENFSFSKTFFLGSSYTIRVSNKNVQNADSISYALNVTPDLYPVINVQEKKDSANDRYTYYLGDISDDYGLKRLTFNYTIQKADSENRAISKTLDIPYTLGTSSRFNHYWNSADLGIQPGDKMSCYFEVWDNDGVHGSKSSKSAILNFQMPTANELQKEVDKENKALKDDLKESMKDAKDLKNKMQEMQDKLLDKKNLNWEDKKNITDAMSKQKELQKQLEEIKNKFNQNIEKQNDFKELSESVKEKQQKLQELFNNTMNDEMKKLFEKLEKMLDDLQKKDALEKMEEMKANNEKIEKELDRMLELFKKLEFDQKLQETITKLENLAQKQEELSKKAEDKKADSKDLKDKQDKLKEEAKQAKKDMEDLKKMNEDTKSKDEMKSAEQDMKDAEQNMDDAQQDLAQQKNSKASQSQKKASDNMKEASKKLGEMKRSMEQEEEAEDLQALRQLLKNILSLSFDEEKLMSQIKSVNTNNPKYVDMMKEQQRIKENSEMVEDSLYALAKRVFQLQSFVTKEITDVNKYLGKSINDLEDRNTYKAAGNQQFVMTGYNNLALMLSETQEQMQQSKADSEPKDGKPKMCKNCKKPGNGLPNLSKMQKQLSDKISQLAEQMKKEGSNKPNGQQQGKNGMSKEFAQMAAQQAEMRKALEKINAEQNKDGGKDGKGSLGDLGKAIQQMEQNETDLVNKRITTEMQRRQQEILTRLLEAEKAEKERGEKPERESNTGREIERKIPPSLAEYLKQKQSEVDLYKTVSPSFKPYYKSITEKYFKNISTTF